MKLVILCLLLVCCFFVLAEQPAMTEVKNPTYRCGMGEKFVKKGWKQLKKNADMQEYYDMPVAERKKMKEIIKSKLERMVKKRIPKQVNKRCKRMSMMSNMRQRLAGNLAPQPLLNAQPAVQLQN